MELNRIINATGDIFHPALGYFWADNSEELKALSGNYYSRCLRMGEKPAFGCDYHFNKIANFFAKEAGCFFNGVENFFCLLQKLPAHTVNFSPQVRDIYMSLRDFDNSENPTLWVGFPEEYSPPSSRRITLTNSLKTESTGEVIVFDSFLTLGITEGCLVLAQESFFEEISTSFFWQQAKGSFLLSVVVAQALLGMLTVNAPLSLLMRFLRRKKEDVLPLSKKFVTRLQILNIDAEILATGTSVSIDERFLFGKKITPEEIYVKLLKAEPPILTGLSADKLIFDFKAVAEDEVKYIANKIFEIVNNVKLDDIAYAERSTKIEMAELPKPVSNFMADNLNYNLNKPFKPW